MKKRLLLLTIVLSLLVTVGVSAQDEADSELPSPIPGGTCTPDTAPSGEPITVGGSLALTGAFAPTGNIHRVVGELFVDWVNECGGLLGRPLEWDLRDDQSDAAQAATLYAELVNSSDLVIGPYAAAAILAAVSPVQQAGMIYVTHTNGAPQQEIGDFHFPSWQVSGGETDNPWHNAAVLVFDAFDAAETKPESIFYLTSQFPTTLVMTQAARDIGAERGYEEADYIEYEFGTSDFSAIALRIQAADPDFIYVGAIGLDGVNLYDAFESIGYVPRGIYMALPSPGPVMALGDVVEGVTALSIFEAHSPFTDDPTVAEFVERFQTAAAEENLLTIVETQAAASFSSWQILTAAVTATESLDHEELKAWLLENEFDVAAGTISFDGFNGYGTDFSRLVQIQDGERVIVWPPEFAAPDAEFRYPNE